MATIEKIPLAQIVSPKPLNMPYVRGHISDSHVRTLAANMQLIGYREDRPITVLPLTTLFATGVPEKENKGKPALAWRDGARYVAITGLHRMAALTEAAASKKGNNPVKGWTTIPAVMTKSKNNADIIVEQLRSDADHGLPVTIEARHAAVRKLGTEHKLTTRDIGKMLGYSNASVSRILAGKQAGSGRQTAIAKAKKKPGKKKPTAETPAAWTPKAFLHDMRDIQHDATKNKKVVLDYLATKDGRVFASMLKTLAVLTAEFAEAAAPKE